MRSESVLINNPTGLHARPAALFTQTAAKFHSKIMVQKGDKIVDAKSMLKILSLGAKQGTTIDIAADGPDEQEAVGALVSLIKSGFGEQG